jgi:outer membrane protein OmpA-like peptidoglycan-associated protein
MTRRISILLPGLLALGVVACATSKDIDTKIAEAQSKTDKKLETVETQVEDLQEKQKATSAKVEEQQKAIDQLSQSSKDALKRAQEAGVLAKGKVVFEQTFTEDRVRFKTSSYELSKESKAALDEFAARVKKLDKPVWFEIQGHTDDTGGAAINDALGQQRAEAVRRYLAREHKVPLTRMSTISYGDSLPIAPNKTKDGRAQNRRVVIVVLE